MTTVVCFQSAGTAYCMPVQATRSVCRASGLIALPAPGPDIAGLLPGNPPLTVISPLGAGGSHVLVVEVRERTFGLLVDAVTGLRRINDTDINPPPAGQNQPDRPLVCGTIDTGDQLVLVTDPDALAGRL
jgi:chemotaxis signal transduction protein